MAGPGTQSSRLGRSVLAPQPFATYSLTIQKTSNGRLSSPEGLLAALTDFTKRYALPPSEGVNPWCRLTGQGLALVAKLVSGFSVRWIGAEPDTCQRVYFANHTSHLDAVVLWAALPGSLRQLTRPVAAQDYWGQTPMRRFLANSFNAILIDRKQIKVHQSPVELMLREIGNTYSLIVFPEGSRAVDGEMGEFKSGLYYLAKKRPDLELIPVYMDNMNRILPRGEFVPVPLLSSISIGAPIFLEPKESKQDFLNRAMRSVRALKER
jgi:1-acyl-sn-glycerol-3-phosphate acyltransferase